MEEKKKQPSKQSFCANEQKITKHILSVAGNGEIVLSCEDCGTFLKFPAGLSKDEFNDLVDKNAEASKGQITQESIDKSLMEYADEE